MALCFLRLGNASRDESKEVRSRKKGKGIKKEKKGFVFSLLPLKSVLAGL